jgi:putative FmdB family regulatory protein
MPTYDYACRGCDYTFEFRQEITADPLKNCPGCEKPTLYRKVGGGAAVIFKGSGFYETDYKKKPKPKPKLTEPKPEAK